jgi:hypothetical protein
MHYELTCHRRKSAGEDNEKGTFDEGVIDWPEKSEEVGAAFLRRVQQGDAAE